jgi:hypothetical protein
MAIRFSFSDLYDNGVDGRMHANLLSGLDILWCVFVISNDGTEKNGCGFISQPSSSFDGIQSVLNVIFLPSAVVVCSA